MWSVASRSGYPSWVPSPFRRRAKSDDLVADAVAQVESSEQDKTDPSPKTRAYTPGKGRPTPKRQEFRRNAEAPPADRKEAARRLRERQRKERLESRQRMMAGDDKYLPVRDRGPERALVRDIIDARRNVGSYFLITALLILVGTSGPMPPGIKLGAEVLWYALALAFIADCVLISRRVRKLVRERHPGTDQKLGSLYLYGIMRSITFRKLRMPNPRRKLGDKV